MASVVNQTAALSPRDGVRQIALAIDPYHKIVKNLSKRSQKWLSDEWADSYRVPAAKSPQSVPV